MFHYWNKIISFSNSWFLNIGYINKHHTHIQNFNLWYYWVKDKKIKYNKYNFCLNAHPKSLKVVQPGHQHQALGCIHERVMDKGAVMVISISIVRFCWCHGNSLMKGKASTVVPVSINVCEHSHIKHRLLLL